MGLCSETWKNVDEGCPNHPEKHDCKFYVLKQTGTQRTVDENIKMGNVEPFLEWMKVVVERIVIRCLRWTNEMSIRGQIRACNVLLSMILYPITLIDCIILPI